MKKRLIIFGPTSTGKTDLALQLAHKFQGELISVDSRQVYKYLDIGAGKLPGKEVKAKKSEGFWELDGVRIWMYDVVNPKIQYTVADYVKDANKVILEIRKKGKLPILVGGTGLYIKALVDGLPNLSIPIDKKIRKGLEKLSLIDLQKKLKQISTKRWEIMNDSDRQNPRRLIRAIEMENYKGNKGDFGSQELVKEPDILKIGLTATREILYQRSDERVVSRINQGMIEEAEKLWKDGLSLKRMKQLGLEYGILADYLEGKITSKEELIKILQGKIHGYIRRQLTWFKKETKVNWFDITRKNTFFEVENLVGIWYYSQDATQD